MSAEKRKSLREMGVDGWERERCAELFCQESAVTCHCVDCMHRLKFAPNDVPVARSHAFFPAKVQPRLSFSSCTRTLAVLTLAVRRCNTSVRVHTVDPRHRRRLLCRRPSEKPTTIC